MVLPFLNVTKSLERGFKHIGSLVEERKRLEERYGKDFQDRPVRCVFFSAMTPLGSFREQNDILTWLAEISKGRELTTREMTSCILIMNFVAIHTTTMARKPTVAHKSMLTLLQVVTHSIYDLAAHPEYIQPLRQEIEAVLKEEGWSKDSVAKMSKLDSFIKETMRLAPIGACTCIVFRHYYLL